ncbi:MAG: DUF4019 domain-containing protein [Parachlamydiaceae bacterium]|nr:DUF4019 domain-containing protein [Parachlamydiaceae bacterium]
MKRRICTFFVMLSTLGSNLIAENPAQNSPQMSTQTDAATGNQTNDMAAWMIEASRAAQEYVDLLDNGRYAESWTKGAQVFEHKISQAEWVGALNMARARLGSVKSRTLKDEKPAFDPKGLPKGPYMVVEYNTSFEFAPNSGELLTLMRESDGRWKVLTYQVN